MTSEEQKNEGVSKGFAGLSSMISDVEDVVTSVEARKSESLPDVDAVKIHRSEPQPADDEAESILDPYQQSPGVSSELKWLVIVGVIILGLSWLNSEPTNKSSVPPHIDYSTPPPNVNSTAAHEDSQHAPKHPSGPIRPTEEKPPVGTSLNFNAAQIRYCLAEDIRLGQAKEIINNYLTSDVDRFNAMVTDYNSRCGHFRYRAGALESAKSDVERYRENLESEGRDRFTRHSPKGSQQIPANSQLPKPDNMIVDLQKRLNELGYDAGKADGLAGGKTRTAIMSVQRALGIPVNGIANIDLLKRLDSANPRSNAQVVVQPTLPTDKIIPPAIEPRMPNIVEPEVGKPDLSGANRSEQEAIEKACNSTRQYSGPAAYYDCLTREVNGLSAYRGKPDLSSASRSEQEAIEKACNSTRQYSGPAAYYDCLTREVNGLSAYRGKPDLSSASRSEQEAIEKACNSTRQYSGPAAYYDCLTREVNGLSAYRGKPDLSSASRSEQEAIEKACNSTRQYSGPAAYYDCLTREVNGLSAYRGKPDLSSASRSEQEAIEKACNSTRQYSGPAAYYDCLTREIQNSHIR